MSYCALFVAGFTLCSAGGGATQDAGALRRGTLGIVVRTPRNGSTAGAEVASITIGSSAYKSEIRAGDVITAWNARPIHSPSDFVEATSRLRSGQTHHVQVSRQGRILQLSIPILAVPFEQGDQQVEIQYSWFKAADGTDLRALITRPGQVSGPWPVVLLLPGLGGLACDDPGSPMYAALARTLTRRGYVVVRWDQRGCGDSYGQAYADVDFEAEVGDGIEVFKQTSRLPGIDRSRIYLFGIGTGGVLGAHLVARQDGAAGLATWGTISRPLVECLIETAREQGRIAGLNAAEVNRRIRLTIRFYERMLDGVPPDQIIGQYAQLKDFVDASGYVQGKTPLYWQQLDSTLYWKLFGYGKVPVLALYGAYDFVASLADQDNIVALARAAGRANVHAVVVPDTDHHMNTVSSRQASFQKLQSRQYSFNPVVADALLKWITKLEQWRAAGTPGGTQD